MPDQPKYTSYDLSQATESAYDAASRLSGLYSQIARLITDENERRVWRERVPEPSAAFRAVPLGDVEAHRAAAVQFTKMYQEARPIYEALAAAHES